MLLAVLALFSAVTSTFMVEAMSLANAINKKRRRQGRPTAASTASRTDDGGLEGLFDITDSACAEMASLAAVFFSPLGEKLFYACFIIYLYGDLCIYAVRNPTRLVIGWPV